MAECEDDFMNAFTDLEQDTDYIEDMKDLIETEGGNDNELESFLEENKLSEHLSLFRDQQIDFETLMILTEPDLKSLGLPIGPFRKLIVALQKRRKGNVTKENADAEDIAHNNSDKSKDEADITALPDEGNNFRIIDESGDDSDAHSTKSEPGTDLKNKEDSKSSEPDKYHPYQYDLMNFKLPEEFATKIELQEPASVDSKTFEMITDDRKLRSAIRALRKEKIIAVDFKQIEAYERTLTIMQISTQNADYLIDFGSNSKMNQLVILLTDIFVNPNILKVFYEARHQVKFLQKFYKLFTINIYCVRSAVKELKYETSSLYGLINKYISYFKTTNSECTQRPLRNDVKTNLRKETHYLLHIYYKTRNEAIEAGIFDKLVENGIKICGQLHVLAPRTPSTLFPDFDKFNEAQKLAAEELNNWRETMAKDKNVNPNTIISLKEMKVFCLSLPGKKEELLSVTNSRAVRVNYLKLMAIMKMARKKYFNEPKDASKYELNNIEIPKVAKNKASTGPKASPKPSPKLKPGVSANTPTTDLKRKNDEFPRPSPAKKPRYRSKKNINSPKRGGADVNKPNNAKTSVFRKPANQRGGFQGNFGNNPPQQQIPALLKYPTPQHIWQSSPNPNFNNANNYGSNFKYY